MFSADPGSFQRVMKNLMVDIPQVCVYSDDILITGKTEEKHLENLEKVLTKLKEAGLRLKEEKL